MQTLKTQSRHRVLRPAMSVVGLFYLSKSILGTLCISLIVQGDEFVFSCLSGKLCSSHGMTGYFLDNWIWMTDTLIVSKYIYSSKLDLRSGYWQVEIDEADMHNTKFSVENIGFFEYSRMAVGLTDATPTFQRPMEHCMSWMDLNVSCSLTIFFIFSENFEEHISRLEV